MLAPAASVWRNIKKAARTAAKNRPPPIAMAAMVPREMVDDFIRVAVCDHELPVWPVGPRSRTPPGRKPA